MIALARKYRPKQFADLIVQTHVAAALRGAVAAGPVAPRHLFARPPRLGEKTAGRLPPRSLYCARRRSYRARSASFSGASGRTPLPTA